MLAAQDVVLLLAIAIFALFSYIARNHKSHAMCAGLVREREKALLSGRMRVVSLPRAWRCRYRHRAFASRQRNLTCRSPPSTSAIRACTGVSKYEERIVLGGDIKHPHDAPHRLGVSRGHSSTVTCRQSPYLTLSSSPTSISPSARSAPQNSTGARAKSQDAEVFDPQCQ